MQILRLNYGTLVIIEGGRLDGTELLLSPAQLERIVGWAQRGKWRGGILCPIAAKPDCFLVHVDGGGFDVQFTAHTRDTVRFLDKLPWVLQPEEAEALRLAAGQARLFLSYGG